MSLIPVRLLENFYQTSQDEYPEPVARSRSQILEFLRGDNARGVILEGPEGSTTSVAVWTGNDSGENDDYYWQFLPLEDPGDAQFEGTAAQAVDAALEEIAALS